MMQLLGINITSGQPTITHPLDNERLLIGQSKRSQKRSETWNTVTQSEQSVTRIGLIEVVNQAEKAEPTGYKPVDNVIVDLTV